MAYVNKSDIYKLFDESNGVIRLHIADVDMLPTADVEEVKHGEWITPEGNIKIFEDRYVICSKCNVILPKLKELSEYWYCPNCGAKMYGMSEI